MPPHAQVALSATEYRPRIIFYHQTHHTPAGDSISLLPLVTESSTTLGITHLIIAAIHLNEKPADITLNDNGPSHPKFDSLWSEVALFQDLGVPVLAMLGGAAQGTFRRLDGDAVTFEAYYGPLRDMLRTHKLDGIDLDIEEEMSLGGVVRLIDRLRVDFGSDFMITLAPVATALLGREHLSGFDYEALEVMRGREIAWYNVQHYNGWGSVGNYMDIIQRGWPAERVILGVLTNPRNGGSGYVAFEELVRAVKTLQELFPRFGGIMGWEFFNAHPGAESRPWEWAHALGPVVDHNA